MFIAMNRFRVKKGSEEAFEQVTAALTLGLVAHLWSGISARGDPTPWLG
jgi:hypothetical protein